MLPIGYFYGVHRLSPAYDQVCTRWVIDNDDLALTVGGKKANLNRNTWLEYARYCKIPDRAAERILKNLAGAAAEAMELISRSLLGGEMKKVYQDLIAERSRALAGDLG